MCMEENNLKISLALYIRLEFSPYNAHPFCNLSPLIPFCKCKNKNTYQSKYTAENI